MTVELLELLFFILILFSGISMISYAQSKNDEKSLFFNPMGIYEYILITKQERGRIGIWFWVFSVSIVFLFILFFTGY